MNRCQLLGKPMVAPGFRPLQLTECRVLQPGAYTVRVHGLEVTSPVYIDIDAATLDALAGAGRSAL